MGLRCLHTSIFIKTPSLKGLPTKAEEDPSPHEMRLSPLDINPIFSGEFIITIIIIVIIIIIIIYDDDDDDDDDDELTQSIQLLS